MNATRDMLEEMINPPEGAARELTSQELDIVSGAIAVLPTYPGGQKPSPTFPPIPE